MDRERRATWTNHTGNQSCEPLEACSPESLDDVVELVKLAHSERITLRAVGSGHSWSDVALTSGLLLEPQGLSEPEEVPTSMLSRQGTEQLVRVQGGIRIRDLNEHLWERELALPNMGGYDGQTIAGVISTSTHGSGIGFGPLADLVRSLDVVASGPSGPRLLRIEPEAGPTDPQAADDLGSWELVQNDDLFHAAVTGMGCMGVIYAVTLGVRERFRLAEVRTVTTWEAVRGELPGGEALRQAEHWELLVNPYARDDGKHTCLITERTSTPPAARPDAEGRRRPWVNEVLASLPITHGVLNVILDIDPDGIPAALDDALERLADEGYTDRSYRVFNIGAANRLPAYSSEIGVPLVGDTPRRAVESVFQVAEQRRRLGDSYHTAPFSLRFVKQSPALLSMMEGRDTMMIELIMQTDTEGGFELLAAHENALYELGGRPHWGQVNSLTVSAVRSLYPRLDTWLEAHRELNQSGVFDSPFSQRVGLSTPAGPG